MSQPDGPLTQSKAKAEQALEAFMRNTEKTWMFIVLRCHLPRKSFYAANAKKDVQGLKDLMKEHLVEALRDYPQTDEQGRLVRRIRVFVDTKEVAAKSFTYYFDAKKGALQVEYS